MNEAQLQGIMNLQRSLDDDDDPDGVESCITEAYRRAQEYEKEMLERGGRRLNTKGTDQIKKFVNRHIHKLRLGTKEGFDYNYWMRQAQYELDFNRPPIVTVSWTDSKDMKDHSFTISEDGSTYHKGTKAK